MKANISFTKTFLLIFIKILAKTTPIWGMILLVLFGLVLSFAKIEGIIFADAFFGFAATNNTENSNYLGSDEFVDDLVERGCSVGLITEYVPCGQKPRSEWVLNAKQREEFHQRILKIRSVKPIVLVQFPQDEYGEANICSGAGRVSLHINSQGGIEPCPFVPLSVDNIRQGGLMAAVKSSFLASIRSRPDLLSRDRLACSLYEHYPEVETLLAHNNKAVTNVRVGDASF